MSATIVARFLRAAKLKGKHGYYWSLKNQTLASGGLMLAGTIGCSAMVMWDNRLGTGDVLNKVCDVKNEIDQKHEESRRYFEEKFAKLDAADMETQRLILTCARSTLKGFQGDTTEIVNIIHSVDVFEKGCKGLRQVDVD